MAGPTASADGGPDKEDPDTLPKVHFSAYLSLLITHLFPYAWYSDAYRDRKKDGIINRMFHEYLQFTRLR